MHLHHPFVLIASLCVLTAAVGQAQAAPATNAPSQKTVAAKESKYDKALLTPSALQAKAPAEYTVKFVTSAGDFTVKATRAWAPLGADRFYNLVRNHFYDGAAFFRVLPGFMAQFGMSPYPEVSSAWDQAIIQDDPVTQSNKRGFVSFAMAGPNTRTTQIFINYNNNQSLDQNGFAPFATVTNGMEVVDKLFYGYGEGAPSGTGPDQSEIKNSGQAYLEKQFPKLDTIRSATIVTR